MHLTICYNQATKRVAFVEAPEEFIQVLLELGTCNLDALTSLLEPATELQSEGNRNDASKSTPLAKLTSGLGGKCDIPAPMSHCKWMEVVLSAISPGPSLKHLLLSVVRPGDARFPPVSRLVDCKTSRVIWKCPNSLHLTLYNAHVCCPSCKPKYLCYPATVDFLPHYEGQEDIDPAQPLYTCEKGCHILSNNSGENCPKCGDGKLTNGYGRNARGEFIPLAVIQKEGNYTFQGLPTQTPKKAAVPRKMSEVMPVVRRTRDEKLCLLTNELEPLNPHSVVGVMLTMKTSGLLFSAEETSAVSVNLGCKEVLALARLARIPGQTQVLSTVFADVLTTADELNL